MCIELIEVEIKIEIKIEIKLKNEVRDQAINTIAWKP